MMLVTALVAQQIPQVRAVLAAVNPGSTHLVPPSPQVSAATAPPTHGSNNPFAALINQHQPLLGAVSGTSATSSSTLPGAQHPHVSTQPAATPAQCLIPGCGKPVHVDSTGVSTGDYCSLRHRE